MNKFDSYIVDPKVTEDLAMAQRAIEMKRMYENTIPQAVEKLEKAHKQQMKGQDNRNLVSIEPIKPGTHVYIKAKPIRGKLEPSFTGPYVVNGMTKHGNYELFTTDGIFIKSLPRHKLKEVEKTLSNERAFEIEKILDCRSRNGNIEYYVKWKNSSDNENSWVMERHVECPELIQNFHESFHKESGYYIKTIWS
jgi:hypothetical protein